MTNPGGNPMDAVAALMLERQRFEAWLAQLESRRAITPPHVFERVRADYEKRLREVTEQLTSRSSEMQATMAALTERLARLQIEETALRDERYEAELRSHVGEMTAEEWNRMQRESDERIARIGTERTTVTGEIGRLKQLLSMAGERAAAAGVTALEAPSPEQRRAGPGFDELEFLKSVTTGGRGGNSPSATGAPARPSKPVATDSVAPRTSAPTPRAPTPAGTPAAPGPTPDFPGSSAGNSRDDPKPVEGRDKEPEEVPSFLRDVPLETARTLKCGGCGALNLPTEWYCERCGAELAGM